MTDKRALIVGSTGITGLNLAERLVTRDWTVFGLARRPGPTSGVRPVVADLLDPSSLETALHKVLPTHIFFATWMRKPTEAEMVVANGAMVRNLLAAVAVARSVKHVALVTGLKHYLGSFETYGTGAVPPTPFREEQGRQGGENFYYAQLDELFAAAARDGFGWSVHRAHTLIGYAVGNAMNMGVTLAAHATICRETGRPFRFPGSDVQWNSLTDVTDARLLARHLEWAATTPAARDEAFNVVNGDVFRWSWMWPRLAAWFGIEPVPISGERVLLETQWADAAPLWAEIAAKHGLRESRLDVLASAWHTDGDLGRPIEVVTDMSKSRKLGFLAYQSSDDAFFELFTRLRETRLIP